MEERILTDRQIVELFFARDERALGELARAYGTYLTSVALNVLKNREDCEECLNDVYLSLWNHIPPERPLRLKAYAARAVRNAALRCKQMKGAADPLPIDELAEELACKENVEESFDARRLQEALNDFVRSLSKRERFVFIGRYYNSDSVSSLAQTLGVSEQAVYKSLTKCKTTLERKLRKEGFL